MASTEAPVAIGGESQQPERVKTSLDPEGLIAVCEKLTQDINRAHLNHAQAEAQMLYEKARSKALKHRLQVAKWNLNVAEASVLESPLSHEKHLEYADALENLAVVQGNIVRNEVGLSNAWRTWLVAATAASLVELPWIDATGRLAAAYGVPQDPDAAGADEEDPEGPDEDEGTSDADEQGAEAQPE